MEKIVKTRSDAWGESLGEEIKWRLWRYSKPLKADEEPRPVLNSPEVACAYVINELHEEPPSRAGWYRFLCRMRAEDRMGKLAGAVAEAEKVAASHGISNEVFVETLKTLAIDRVMSGDEKAFASLTQGAAAIWDRAQKEREINLKTSAEARKDEELKLAREKFEAAEKRLAAVQNAIDAAKNGTIDPTKVADEIDRILGRKK